jgi:hypothetical protein
MTPLEYFEAKSQFILRRVSEAMPKLPDIFSMGRDQINRNLFLTIAMPMY